MRKYRPWFFLGLLLLLFLEVWLGFPLSLENVETSSVSLSPDRQSQDAQQKMKGVHLVETHQGSRDWELFADAAEGYEGKGKWQLKKVKIQFYSESTVQFTVVGDIAEVDTKTKDMKIEGKVRTTAANGYIFESPLLLYMAKQRLLQSPVPVTMKTPKDQQGAGFFLSSQYMRCFVDQSEIELVGKVHATKGFGGNKSIALEAGKAVLSAKGYQAHFKEGVAIEFQTMKLEGPEAKFQYLPNSSFIESVQLLGGVRISDLDKFATSEQVQIDPEKNQLVLRGQPRVVQGQDELMGEQIVFVDGGKKVKIEKMKAKVDKTGNEP